MENLRRRELIKSLIGAPFITLLPLNALAGEKRSKVQIELPPLPIQDTYLKGEKKGGRVLIVGGIHGNEPGAYKAAEILRHVKVKRGEIFIAPRMNFVSILANRRGYNGDMNRKFASLSPKDPDYKRVNWLKNYIKEVKPDILLTLHDGFGFHSVNPKSWGQCIVIDEERYRNFQLGKVARLVSERVNRFFTKREWKVPVYNTHTFSPNTKHPEQRKSLTYFCLKEANVPAICLETSKQMPTLELKVKTHLLLLKEFFNIYGIEIEPDFDYIVSHLNSFLKPKVLYSVDLNINGRRVSVSSSKTFKVPKGSRVEFLAFHGTDGTNAVSPDVNMNLRKIGIRRRISFDVKDDFKRVFKVRFTVG